MKKILGLILLFSTNLGCSQFVFDTVYANNGNIDTISITNAGKDVCKVLFEEGNIKEKITFDDKGLMNEREVLFYLEGLLDYRLVYNSSNDLKYKYTYRYSVDENGDVKYTFFSKYDDKNKILKEAVDLGYAFPIK